VVSRAVAKLTDLLQWTKGMYLPKDQNTFKNGLICLKGGDIDAELSVVSNVKKFPISNYFTEEFFKDKFIVYKEQ